jgi:AcrR family transcriptional regulator
MGHREDLMIGAKRCLIEKGYARTTARDIVAVSGTNLASIGYHYGSKDALLNRALVEAVGDSGSELFAVLAEGEPDAGLLERFETVWTRMIEQFPTDRRVWLASFEAFAQVDHVQVVREALADGMEQGREGAVEIFKKIGMFDETTDKNTLRAVGSFYHALVTGVIAQLLVDPEHAPTGEGLTDALRAITSAVHRDEAGAVSA